MSNGYSNSRKQLFLNNRIDEYCLFLKGVNAGISLNNARLISLCNKLAILPMCKVISNRPIHQKVQNPVIQKIEISSDISEKI